MTDDELAAMVEYAAEAARLRKEVERLRVALEREQTEHANCEQFHHDGSMAKSAAMVAVMEPNTARRELLSDAYDSWFYGDEASYSSPPWVDRAMALLGKAR